MDKRAAKVKEIITKRIQLQMIQYLTSTIPYNEITALQNAVACACEGIRSPSFVDHFNDTYLPDGKKVGKDGFDAVESLEDALINHNDPAASCLEDELGL